LRKETQKQKQKTKQTSNVSDLVPKMTKIRVGGSRRYLLLALKKGGGGGGGGGGSREEEMWRLQCSLRENRKKSQRGGGIRRLGEVPTVLPLRVVASILR